MRMSTIVSGLVGGILMFGLAAPAAAQAKVDFSAGYQYFVDHDGENMPAGWAISAGRGKDWVKFVADFSGNYTDRTRFHMFQIGVEFSGKGKRVVPFGRLLLGMAFKTDTYDTQLSGVLTPEVGVRIMANDRVGFQTSVGVPSYEGVNGYRFFAGIVIRK
jgi:hypothetical protein